MVHAVNILAPHFSTGVCLLPQILFLFCPPVGVTHSGLCDKDIGDGEPCLQVSSSNAAGCHSNCCIMRRWSVRVACQDTFLSYIQKYTIQCYWRICYSTCIWFEAWNLYLRSPIVFQNWKFRTRGVVLHLNSCGSSRWHFQMSWGNSERAFSCIWDSRRPVMQGTS